jgi:hypothetical protein
MSLLSAHGGQSDATSGRCKRFCRVWDGPSELSGWEPPGAENVDECVFGRSDFLWERTCCGAAGAAPIYGRELYPRVLASRD